VSLLIRALKEAEDKREAAQGGSEWSLEPMRTEEKGPSATHGAQLPPAWIAPGFSALRRLSLIPLTLLIAGIVLLAYGVYVYVLTRPAEPVVPPSLPAGSAGVSPASPVPPAMPAEQAVTSRPTEDAGPSETTESFKKAVSPAKQRQALTKAEPSRAPLPGGNQAPAADSAPDQRLLAAYAHYQDGDYTGAERDYRAVVESQPGNLDALLGLAATAQASGRQAEAAQWYARVLDLDPGNHLARLALLHQMDTRESAALEARLRQWLTEPASDPAERAFLHYSLAGLLANQGRWPDAQRHYFDAVALRPEHAEFRYNLAVSLDQLGQYRAALDHYRTVLELLVRTPSRSIDPASVRQRMNELQEAAPPPP
jgi:tetratricopeptide (TPR) repeat protein